MAAWAERIFDTLAKQTDEYFDLLLARLDTAHRFASGVVVEAAIEQREFETVLRRFLETPTDFRGNRREVERALMGAFGRGFDMAREWVPWAGQGGLASNIRGQLEIAEGPDGVKRVKGTRIRVKDIVSHYNRALEELKEDFPHISEEQIQAAISYWWAHGPEIQREIDAEREVFNARSGSRAQPAKR